MAEKSKKRPESVNVRNPIAIDRVVQEVESGGARNWSEAAENLILKGSDAARLERKESAVA